MGEVAVFPPSALAALPVVFAQRRLQVGYLPLPRHLGAVAVVEGAGAGHAGSAHPGHHGPHRPKPRGGHVAHHAPEAGPELGAAVGVVAGDASVAVDGARLADVSVRRRADYKSCSDSTHCEIFI